MSGRNCSVVFVSQSDGGWAPIELRESVVATMPDSVREEFETLRKASSVVEDLGFYCVFFLDIVKGDRWLGYIVTDAGATDEVPSYLMLIINIGLCLILGRKATPQFVGEFERLELDDTEGGTYVKYENRKESEDMKDIQLSVFHYTSDGKFDSSYSPEDRCFMTKNGEKKETSDEIQRVVDELFDPRHICKEGDTE